MTKLICALCVIFSISCLSLPSYSQVPVEYTYPLSNAKGVSEKTSIGIRYGEPLISSLIQTGTFTINGSSTGIHTAKIALSVDGRTVIFTVDNFFESEENIQINIAPFVCTSGKETMPYSLSFQIAKIGMPSIPIPV